ncbi:3'-5' exonuclease [Nannocystis bainbridge]|uniref:Exonuclease domain-containing protein n=1 Tax=Nannocystis bainbridge TaxID=2995303 RepID=A0ABT5DT62_9BACT|nr:3'-5' exonuclease [Nannocystis bainbridge]MDC0716721.1 exonuclease domain-containing protein [Nannocystis bainbridge]
MSETIHRYLVVDLEATCDDQGAVPREESEIIEIGAVLVDAATLAPIAEFQTFVRPRVHPRLSPFCVELTTITQADVAGAPPFRAVAPKLAAFGQGALFCSWGGYDRNQLARDARRAGVRAPLGPGHLNLKEAFARAAGEAQSGTYGALRRVGLEPTGTHHRGIDDARNIARLLPYALGRAAIPARGARRPR